MTAIEKKPRIAGVAGTIAFWAAFLLLSTIFSLFARKPVYKTVQIRLDSPQTQTQQARAAAAPKATESVAQAAPSAPPPPPAPAQTASKPAPQTATQPTAQAQNASAQSTTKPAQNTAKPATSTKPTTQTAKPAASPKPAAQPKPQPAKPASQPQKTAPAPVLQKSVEELMAEQTANRPKKHLSQAEIDALFSDADENTSVAPTNTAQTQTVQQALDGSAATASNSANTAASVTSAKQSATLAASAGTSNALSKIAATQYTKVSGNGVSSVATVATGGTTDGKVAVQMTDGTARTLLDPATPSITLSNAAAALIDGKKQVQIRFTVTAAGTVPVSDIRITPASILHTIVQAEITAQISRWRFSPANNAGTAVFDYTINVQ